jgi:glutathione peroxidase
MSAHDFSFPGIDGGEIDLSDHSGKAILIVNTASACGFTPQYKDLQGLWEAEKGNQLVVVGVPSNNFGAQEPGSDGEVKSFCETKFGVTFPMAAKQEVVGAGAHPFYKWITDQAGEGAAPKWNFHKYLIGPDGALVESFPSNVAPQSAELKDAIANCLK